MRNHFFNFSILLITSSIFSCNKIEKQVNDESELVPSKYIEQNQSDTLKEPNYIAIFDQDSKKKTQLSINELRIINHNIIKGVNDYNDKLKIRLEKWNKESKTSTLDFEKEKLNLRYFYRQYFVSTNESGDKIVNVFCFCVYYDDDWRKNQVYVMDGGNCYLNITINITKNKIEYFGTHGEA